MCKQVFLLFGISLLTAYSVGCGGSVAPGVADAPDEPAPVLTAEEESAEMESAEDAAGQE